LAADLGAALGGAAHLGELRRLRVGPFTLAEAHSLAEIEADADALTLSPAIAMRGLPKVTADDAIARAVAHGSVFPVGALAPTREGESRNGSGSDPTTLDGPDPFAIVDEQGDLLAVYERRGAGLKPAVVVRAATGGST
jgi:tRNA pseudouridine55 synthase